jgi:hypothetical protein
MARSFWLAMIAVVIVSPLGLHGAKPQYENAKIVDIQKKVESRVLYYIVNTPVTKDEPYYEISVQLGDTVYVGRYSPRHSGDTLPDEWTEEGSVPARVDSHYLYLKKPSGVEVQLVITKRNAVKAEPTTSEPAPAGK